MNIGIYKITNLINANIAVNLFGKSIFHNLNGRSNKAYGFRWKYIE